MTITGGYRRMIKMAEIHETLLAISLQLEEQLKFYKEIGMTDIGGSLPNAKAMPEPLPVAIADPVPVAVTETLAAKPEPPPEPVKPVPPLPSPPPVREEVMPKKKEVIEESGAQVGLFGDFAPPPAESKKPSGLPVLDLYPNDATLEDIRADIGDCTRCKLHEHRTKIVFGEGNPQAKLMFIGEGPGVDEDKTGRPFVGQAGQLLDKIIVAINCKREDVYIANVVKCRPPLNRTPEKDETDTCEQFLFRQIKLIQPKVIVALGSPAFQCLLRTKETITRARGEFREWNGIQVMPTFHPAYLLRSPDKKREVWDDMKKVRDYLTAIGEA